jgi:hypothetical protein
MVKIALLGCGLIGDFYAQALLDQRDCRCGLSLHRIETLGADRTGALGSSRISKPGKSRIVSRCSGRSQKSVAP